MKGTWLIDHLGAGCLRASQVQAVALFKNNNLMVDWLGPERISQDKPWAHRINSHHKMQIMEIIELELKNLSYNHKVTFNITAKTKMINLSWGQIIKISNIDTLDLLQE